MNNGKKPGESLDKQTPRVKLQRPPQQKPDIHGQGGFGNPHVSGQYLGNQAGNNTPNQQRGNKKRGRKANNNPQKPPSKWSLAWRFFLSFVGGVFFLGLVAVGAISLLQWQKNSQVIDVDLAKVLPDKPKKDSFINLFLPPQVVKVLLLGTDEADTRTDFIMAMAFYPKTGDIHLISIPRDTYTVMPADRVEFLRSKGLKTGSKTGIMKLNEVHHHAGSAYGIELIKAQVEDLLNINFDYYAKVNLDGFRHLVDAVGGIEFDVPQRMKYHDDVDLYIDLQPGLQILTGEQSEWVVRYRRYATGDLKRVEVQQDFMKAAISQLTSSENIMNNLESYIKIAMEYTETDLILADAIKYIPSATRIAGSKVHTYTAPGTPKDMPRPGGGANTSFYILDDTALLALSDEIFYPGTVDKPKNVSSKGKKIQVANSTGIPGFAASNRDFLENEGFKVDSISDYSEPLEQTIIIVKAKGMGEDLLKLYQGANIKVDSKQTGNFDIVVILGAKETNGLQVKNN